MTTTPIADESEALIEDVRQKRKRRGKPSFNWFSGLEAKLRTLTAERNALQKALREIAESKYCNYEHTASRPDNQYGIGVTDGHRYCANIAKAALAQEPPNAMRSKPC